MLHFMKSKDGVILSLGWVFAWLVLEMVFFGEPVFCYGSVPAGYSLYFITLAIVVACAVIGAAASFLRRDRSDCGLLTLINPAILLACGFLGSFCLLAIRLTMGGVLPLPFAAVLACAAVFAVFSVFLLAFFFQTTMRFVHERGLREVLGSALAGVALSFLLLPRFLRDGPYGLALVIASPLVVALSLWLSRGLNVPDAHDRVGVGVPVVVSLAALGVLSFLTYLLAYFDFVSAGFKVVVEEDPYFYLAVFVLIGALLAALSMSLSEHAFTESVFMYVLAGIVLLTLLVLFGLLNYLNSGGEYVYALTKFLRRAVKIAALFMTVVLVYQSGLRAAPTFLLVVVLPLVLAKVVQMALATVPSLNALIGGSEFLYLSGIGFSAVAAWVLLLVFYVQGTVVRYNRRALEESNPGIGEANNQAAAFADEFALSDRERDVLEYLAAGNSVRAISSALCVSENTVKTHVAAIYRKTGAHSRQEIIDMVKGRRA